MNVARPACCLAVCLILTLTANAQQPASNPLAACGSTNANFTVKNQTVSTIPNQPPPGKALVYVIETMDNEGLFATTKVNLGLDGNWIGATNANTHINFIVDPGAHHLCAAYQGHAVSMDDEGHTLLLHLDAQAGHTYYLRYHALFLRDSPGIALFDLADEDEGLFLIQRTQQAISTLKK
ncbi:hypothetical protein [Granulicella sp. L46]|uniref:hypothetical protein n=1 Tax=Granulicella sp. L46 TaxID=1641865 RepID=UPI00131B64F2|nr:hypothetical protein [Granulicella sp. L46]